MNINRKQAIRLLSKAHDFIKIHENIPTGEDCLKSLGVTQNEIDDALKQ